MYKIYHNCSLGLLQLYSNWSSTCALSPHPLTDAHTHTRAHPLTPARTCSHPPTPTHSCQYPYRPTPAHSCTRTCTQSADRERLHYTHGRVCSGLQVFISCLRMSCVGWMPVTNVHHYSRAITKTPERCLAAPSPVETEDSGASQQLPMCTAARSAARQPGRTIGRRPGAQSCIGGRHRSHRAPPSTHLRSPGCSGGRPTSRTSPSSTPSPSWADGPVHQREELAGASAHPALPRPHADLRGSCPGAAPTPPQLPVPRASSLPQGALLQLAAWRSGSPVYRAPPFHPGTAESRSTENVPTAPRERPWLGFLQAAHLPRGHSQHIWVANKVH